MSIPKLCLVLICVFKIISLAVAQSNPTITVIPNPTKANCISVPYSYVFPSPGYINVEITAKISVWDSFQWGPKSQDDSITITATAYSDNKPDVALDITNSSYHSALRLNIAPAVNKHQMSFDDESSCPSRVVVVVSVPDSVHFVCFNGECICNCAVKGAGLNIHFMAPQAGEMDMISAAGFGYSRMDFDWTSIETVQGQYDFSTYDVLFENYAPYNITAYNIFDYYCPFYDGGSSPKSSQGIAAFANFATASSTKYAGRGYVWELYNEPNIFFWTPTPNAQQYLTMAAFVGKQFKTVTPREIFVGPAIASVGYDPSVIDVNFLQTCLSGGMLEWWDAISVHLYRFANPETILPELRQMREMINTYLPADKLHVGILSGEWGYSTTWQDSPVDVQGLYHVREMLFNLANEVAISIWYDWTDDGTDPNNQEDNFGTVYNQYFPGRTPCYNPKPSYTSRLVMQQQIGGKHFNKRLWVNNADIYVYLFNTAGEEDFVLVAWTSDSQGYTVQIPSSDNSTFMVVTTYNDKQYAVNATNGYVEVQVSDGPIYISATSDNPLLSIIAATTRLLPEYWYPFGWVPLKWNIPNPTKTSVIVGFSADNSTKLNPGDTAFFTQSFEVAQTGDYSDTVVTVYTSLGSFSLYTAIAGNPVTISILPSTPSYITVQISNPSGVAFDGFATFLVNGSRGTDSSKKPFSMPQGQTSSSIVFPMKLTGDVTGLFTVYVSLLDSNQNVILSDSNTFQMVDDFSRIAPGNYPTGYSLLPDGDPNVDAMQTMMVITPEGAPANVTTIELSFSMAAGWKFWRIVPDSSLTMNTLPKTIAIWVFSSIPDVGDNTELRVVDSTGQTFQLTFSAVNWVGWNYVVAPVVANGNYWGGANDGQFHLPLTFDDIFLFDTTRQAQAGVVYFSAPVLTY